MTNSSGATQNELSYDPSGRSAILQNSSQLPDFQYAGYYTHTASGLNLTLHRAYSPTLGRFINRDPMEEDSQNNLYAYAENNPVGLVDPSGLAADTFMYDSVVDAVKAGISENRATILATRSNRSEMGFWVYKKPDECTKWAYSEPFTSSGTYISQSLADAHKPQGMIIGAFAHTHPDIRPWWISDVGYENFSIYDIKLLRSQDMTGYLYNASDQLKCYVPPNGDTRGTLVP
jgi:RHS repeat-associated protein